MSPDSFMPGQEQIPEIAKNPETRKLPFFPLMAVLLPALLALLILWRQGLSIPYQDDYRSVLSFALQYEHTPTPQAKLMEIATVQYNEYRPIFEHVVYAADLALTHHLNFAFLIAIGHLFLLGIGYLLWRIYGGSGHDLGHRLLEFLPISLIFFSLTYWSTLDWAMAELQNVAVIFFSLLALDLILPAGKQSPMRFPAGCAAALLAACTSANGFLLLPVGLLVLLPRRSFGRSILWCASFVLPMAAYLYHAERSAQAGARASIVARPLFFLGVLGCAIPLRWVAAAVGLGLLLLLIFAVRVRFDRVQPAAFYSMIWILLTAGLIGWVRGAGGFGVASRYSIYSILLLIFGYSFLRYELPRHLSGLSFSRFKIGALILSTCFFLLVNAHAYRSLGRRRRMIVAGMEYYREDPQMHSPMIDPAVERFFPLEKPFERTTLQQAVQSGLYQLPKNRVTP